MSAIIYISHHRFAVFSLFQDTLNPKWNSNCQFFIKDLEQDVLCITVFERDQFSPDGQ